MGFVFVFQILRLLCVREVFIVCLGFFVGRYRTYERHCSIKSIVLCTALKSVV